MRPRKAIRGAPADKTVLLYVELENDQLVERARQLGVEAVAVPSLRKLVACTEEIWLPGRLCKLQVVPLPMPDSGRLTLVVLQFQNLSCTFGPKRQQSCSNGHQPSLVACCARVGGFSALTTKN